MPVMTREEFLAKREGTADGYYCDRHFGRPRCPTAGLEPQP